MCFTWPENIGYLLLLIPLAVLLGYGVMRQIQAREAVVNPRMVEAMMPGAQLKVVVVKKVLLFFAIACLLVAMTGPRLCSGGKPVLRKGADLVFVLDVSRSMRARDVPPDRLGQAKYEIAHISRSVSGGRRAILLFAASPLVQSPLSTDQEGFESLLGMASPDLIEEQGTAFRPAIELALTLLQPASERSLALARKGEKIVVLLSDGEDHAGDLHTAVRELKKAGVHFFAIGVGMRQPAVIPIGGAGDGLKRDESGKVVTSSFRAETLESLARDAGGLYFRSRAEHTVCSEVAERINRIAAASRWVMEPSGGESLSLYFVAAALAFLLADTIIGRGRGMQR